MVYVYVYIYIYIYIYRYSIDLLVLCICLVNQGAFSEFLHRAASAASRGSVVVELVPDNEVHCLGVLFRLPGRPAVSVPNPPSRPPAVRPAFPGSCTSKTKEALAPLGLLALDRAQRALQ